MAHTAQAHQRRVAGTRGLSPFFSETEATSKAGKEEEEVMSEGRGEGKSFPLTVG